MIGLTVIAAIPIILMAGTIAWQDYQAIERGAQERAALLDGQVLAQYHAAISTVAARLSAQTPGLARPGCPGAMVPAGLGLLVLDGDGRITCRAGTLPTLPPRPWPWAEAVRGGKPLDFATVLGTGWTVVAIPAAGGTVLAELQPPAWLVVQILPDALQPLDAVWLIDDRQVVAASRGAAEAALPSVPTMQALIAADQVVVRAVSAAGRHYAYAASRLPTGWRLIAATSAARENTAAMRALLIQVAELAVLLLVGTVGVVLGADVAFGQPLRRLSSAVRAWQSGAGFDPGDLGGAPDEVLQLAASFREATGALSARAAELARAREQQNLLVLEVHHRVKNNLQVIASMLNLQASRIRVPEARAEFQAARDRVRALATLHRHLYADGDLHTVNMRSFLEELCGQLVQAMGAGAGEGGGERIEFDITVAELRLSSDQAVPLALIVTEAVTNAVRYAFPGGRHGHVTVSLTERDGAITLCISDDGVGIQAARLPPEAGTRDGIGLQLIRGFSRQLGATLSVDEEQGTTYTVHLPRAEPKLDALAPAADTVA